ncbi:MAG: glycosyltransferase family A protein [Solirubrobacterales bacterium]
MQLPPAELRLCLFELARVLHPHGLLYLEESEPDAHRELLAMTGLTAVEVVEAEQAGRLAALGLTVQAQPSVLRARRPLPAHAHDPSPDPAELAARIEQARQPRTEVTYAIPVHDEEPRLPRFLASLEACSNAMDSSREFVFVTNGCTDRSAEVIDSWIPQSKTSTRRIDSDLGIVPAFRAALGARRLTGLVGKLDADLLLDPHTLDLLEAQIGLDDLLQVAYAEPLPLDRANSYNAAEHEPELLSKRLFYAGKACVMRPSVPLARWLEPLWRVARAEDILLSFAFAFAHGLDAIARARHAVVYTKTVGTFDDLVKQQERSTSDVQRLCKAFPPFVALNEVFQQEVRSAAFGSVLAEANSMAAYTDEWTRLASTK